MHNKMNTRRLKNIGKRILFVFISLLILSLATACDQKTTQRDPTSQVVPAQTQSSTAPNEPVSKPDFSFPFFIFEDNAVKWGLMAVDGQVIVAPEFESMEVAIYPGYYTAQLLEDTFLFSKSGEELIKATQSEFIQRQEEYFNKQSFPVLTYNHDSKLYGYSQRGEFVIPPTYKNASAFKDGYALVQAGTDESFSRVIDFMGNEVLANPKLQFVNIGSGYIASVEELYGYHTDYYKKNIASALDKKRGQKFPMGSYYGIIPLDSGDFFVFDGQLGHFVDATGKKKQGSPSISGFQKFDQIGPLIRGYASDFSYIHIAYFSQTGEVVWESETPLETYQLTEDIEVITCRPYIDLFQSYRALKTSISNNKEAETAINDLIASHSVPSRDNEEHGMIVSKGFVLSTFGEVVTVAYDHYMYGLGAAHPNMVVAFEHYHLKEKRWIELKDLFTKGEEGYQIIEQDILRQIGNEGTAGDYWLDEGLVIDEETAFQIEEKGITIVFQQYEIGPYAIGMPSFTVPYQVLEPHLNKSVAVFAE